jgi:cation transport ATPase
MGFSQWMRMFDAVTNLAQLSGRFPRRPVDADPGSLTPSTGVLGQLETRLTGVVVAALKEAFDRDRARMDLERAHLEAERQRAEEALRAELRRHAAERALGQMRMVAVMAIAVWMLSAALAVFLPGMRGGAGRWLLGGGWAFVLATLACAFAAWRRIASAADSGSTASAAAGLPSLAEKLAPWLLLLAMALSGASLLAAL